MQFVLRKFCHGRSRVTPFYIELVIRFECVQKVIRVRAVPFWAGAHSFCRDCYCLLVPGISLRKVMIEYSERAFLSVLWLSVYVRTILTVFSILDSGTFTQLVDEASNRNSSSSSSFSTIA